MATYSKRHEFGILANTEFLGYYMRKHGVGEETIGEMYNYVEPFERLDADKVWIIAKVTWSKMNHESKVEIIRDYGAENEDSCIGHVADEILETCCRLVLD